MIENKERFLYSVYEGKVHRAAIAKVCDQTIRLVGRNGAAFDYLERVDRARVGVIYGTTPEEAIAVFRAQNMKQRDVLQEKIQQLEAENDRQIVNPWTGE